MRSHFNVRRGLTVCAAAGMAAATIPAADLRAASVASDNPGNPAYDNGWQPGDNGGSGFGPWSMSFTYNTAVQHALDTTSPYDQVRAPAVTPGQPARAWTLYNPLGPNPDPATDGEGTDISQAGRALNGPLDVGQTISATIDNPTERRFFRGYTVRFNTGGDNTTFQGEAISRLSVGTFQYGTNGRWYAGGPEDVSLVDEDTDQGLRIDFTLFREEGYKLVMTPLDNPSARWCECGDLKNPGAGTIDWIEFEMYNTDSDFYPTVKPDPQATDFYIGRMAVTTDPWRLADANGDGTVSVADVGILATNFGLATEEGPCAGDFNGDFMVTVADVGILATQFGQPSAAASSSADFAEALRAYPALMAAVPEPSSALGALAVCGLGLLSRRRRLSAGL